MIFKSHVHTLTYINNMRVSLHFIISKYNNNYVKASPLISFPRQHNELKTAVSPLYLGSLYSSFHFIF